MSLKLLRLILQKNQAILCCSFEQFIQIEGEAVHRGGACCSFCAFTGEQSLWLPRVFFRDSHTAHFWGEVFLMRNRKSLISHAVLSFPVVSQTLLQNEDCSGTSCLRGVITSSAEAESAVAEGQQYLSHRFKFQGPSVSLFYSDLSSYDLTSNSADVSRATLFHVSKGADQGNNIFADTSVFAVICRHVHTQCSTPRAVETSKLGIFVYSYLTCLFSQTLIL